MQNVNLPNYHDLLKDPQSAFKNDQFKVLLNQPPHQSWLRKHPMAKKKVQGRYQAAEYIPIDKVEFLLDYIFQEWKIEVLSVQLILNSVAVTVRLHFKNPVTGEWSFHDGVGAKSVQVDKEAAPANLSAIKDAAVMMALPSAKSFAIKDAAEHLGSIFGRDINREDTIMYTGRFSEDQQDMETGIPVIPQTSYQTNIPPTPQQATWGPPQPQQPQPQQAGRYTPVRQEDMPWTPPQNEQPNNNYQQGQLWGNTQPQVQPQTASPINANFFSNL